MRRDSRPTARQRGYDSTWQKARAAFLRLKPRCDMCGGKAEHVHHKIPHKGNPAIFWNRSQWQPLCQSCHNSHAQQVETRGYDNRIGSDGLPLDSRHPFNREPSAAAPRPGRTSPLGEPAEKGTGRGHSHKGSTHAR